MAALDDDSSASRPEHYHADLFAAALLRNDEEKALSLVYDGHVTPQTRMMLGKSPLAYAAARGAAAVVHALLFQYGAEAFCQGVYFKGGMPKEPRLQDTWFTLGMRSPVIMELFLYYGLVSRDPETHVGDFLYWGLYDGYGRFPSAKRLLEVEHRWQFARLLLATGRTESFTLLVQLIVATCCADCRKMRRGFEAKLDSFLTKVGCLAGNRFPVAEAIMAAMWNSDDGEMIEKIERTLMGPQNDEERCNIIEKLITCDKHESTKETYKFGARIVVTRYIAKLKAIAC